MRRLARFRHTELWISLAIATSFSSVANAGPDVWTSGGPYGGDVQALAIDPATPTMLYAGTSGGGVFRSTDSGNTWGATGLTNLQVHALAINPSTATLFAGTQADGVLKSTDSGRTWGAASTGLTNRPVLALAIDPAPPGMLYAGTEDGGVFKSTNSGGTWAGANTGLTNASVYALAIDPTTPTTLYAGTFGRGVFKSTDSGGTWTAASTGLTYPYVLALAINPTTPATLYAGTYRGYIIGGVFKSTDSGGTWVASSIGLTNLDVRAVAINPTATTLYAGTYGDGVFVSTDSGGRWATVKTGLTDLNVLSLAIDPTAAALYAGTQSGGVSRSTDSGSTWAPASTGLTSLTVNALSINPMMPATLYAAIRDVGVFRSTDSGGSWVKANTGMTGLNVSAVAIDPKTPGTLYAGTAGGGVFKSTDSGGAWFPARKGLPYLYVASLAVNPTNPATLYVAAPYEIGTGLGIFKSTDSGGTWAPTGLTSGNVTTLVINPTTPTTLYAGMKGGVLRSTDAGSTWTGASNGLTVYFVSALEIDPATPATLYLGSENGTFKSTDSGEHWSASNSGLKNVFVHALAVNSTNPSTLYAGTARGVFKSTDSGGTWVAVDSGLPNLPVNALVLDPTGATTLYAGLANGSVWQTTAQTGPTSTALLPSSARTTGLGGAFYTTDLTVANTGDTPTTFTLKFLGNNSDGRSGIEKSFSVPAGATTTFSDVLGSVFGLDSDYGAIRITSPSDAVRVTSQTSTAGFGGTFGQSVPAARPEDLITAGTPRTILGVREDASFRTNLVLANASDEPLDVDVALLGAFFGSGSKRITLPPLGMTQINRVVRELGVTANIQIALLTLSTPSAGKSFAAYASLIDNVTNDPRTLLPLAPVASGSPSPDSWFLPSAAFTSGAGGAFYTTDLVAFTNVNVRYGFKFLGHDVDGRSGLETRYDLNPNTFVSYSNLLGPFFVSGSSSQYGAIRIGVQYPVTDSSFVGFLAQTSTRGFGGTFGQSVPVVKSADLIRTGATRSILAVREDDSFRTNLILANATEEPLDVDVQLISAEGTLLAIKRISLPPLGMTQVTKVVRDLEIAENLRGARLVLSTPTTNGAFASYASVIDNVTNDPRTLLPR